MDHTANDSPSISDVKDKEEIREEIRKIRDKGKVVTPFLPFRGRVKYSG